LRSDRLRLRASATLKVSSQLPSTAATSHGCRMGARPGAPPTAQPPHSAPFFAAFVVAAGKVEPSARSGKHRRWPWDTRPTGPTGCEGRTPGETGSSNCSGLSYPVGLWVQSKQRLAPSSVPFCGARVTGGSIVRTALGQSSIALLSGRPEPAASLHAAMGLLARLSSPTSCTRREDTSKLLR